MWEVKSSLQHPQTTTFPPQANPRGYIGEIRLALYSAIHIETPPVWKRQRLILG